MSNKIEIHKDAVVYSIKGKIKDDNKKSGEKIYAAFTTDDKEMASIIMEQFPEDHELFKLVSSGYQDDNSENYKVSFVVEVK